MTIHDVISRIIKMKNMYYASVRQNVTSVSLSQWIYFSSNYVFINTV